MRLDVQLSPCAWTDDIAFQFVPALDGARLQDFEDEVKAGLLQLWECNGCHIITERINERILHVWLVAGRNFADAVHAINNYMHSQAISGARFRTRNPASLRMYGFLNPQLSNPEMHEYIVKRFD